MYIWRISIFGPFPQFLRAVLYRTYVTPEAWLDRPVCFQWKNTFVQDEVAKNTIINYQKISTSRFNELCDNKAEIEAGIWLPILGIAGCRNKPQTFGIRMHNMEFERVNVGQGQRTECSIGVSSHLQHSNSSPIFFLVQGVQ